MTQPTLHIPMAFTDISGVPAQRFEIPGMGTLYGEGVVLHGNFGSVHLDEGFFLAFHALGRAMFSLEDIEISENGATGQGWQLELNDGYELQQEWPWEWSNLIVVRSFSEN